VVMARSMTTVLTMDATDALKKLVSNFLEEIWGEIVHQA
jgi:hypothetical protein